MQPITITIEGIRIIIEKGELLKTAPIEEHPIQYNAINIKRKYYHKWDINYRRKPSKKALKSLKSDTIVKQEPLLDPCYLFKDS